jgi:hypothetical protein
MSSVPGSTISAILRHDSKVTSYKIALLRAINDVVLSFPDLASGEQAVAIPLRMLADRWIAYYWPFVGPQTSNLQGQSRSAMARPARICRFAASLRASITPGSSSLAAAPSLQMATCWLPT